MFAVSVIPDLLAEAANELAGIDLAIRTASRNAAASTTQVLTAAGDEVSAAIAALLSVHGQEYQAISAQVDQIGWRFAQSLTGAGSAYATAEATNASLLTGNGGSLTAGEPSGSGATPAVGTTASIATGETYAGTASAAASSTAAAAGQGAVIATIPVSEGALGAVVTPDGRYVYVAHADQFSVIDTSSNTVVANPALDFDFVSIRQILMSPTGSHAFIVGNVDPVGAGHYWDFDVRLVGIDTATNTVDQPIVLGADRWLSSQAPMAITPDGSRIYVINPHPYPGWGDTSTLSVIDTATNAVVGDPISVNAASTYALAMAPNGDHVYISGYDSYSVERVFVLDTADHSVGEIPVGSDTSEIFHGADAISPDGRYLYSASNNGLFWVTDTTQTYSMPPYFFPHEYSGPDIFWQPQVSPDGRYVYVPTVNEGGSGIAAFDTARYEFSDPVTLGPGSDLSKIAVTPSGLVYAIHPQADTVSVINPALLTFTPANNGGGGTGGGGLPQQQLGEGWAQFWNGVNSLPDRIKDAFDLGLRQAQHDIQNHLDNLNAISRTAGTAVQNAANNAIKDLTALGAKVGAVARASGPVGVAFWLYDQFVNAPKAS